MRGIALACLLFPACALAQSANDLWRDGYTVMDEFPYVEIEECEPESPVDLGNGLYFECSGYEYPYHYGGAMLVGKAVSFRGRSLQLLYLCPDSDQDCLAGQLAAGLMFKGFRCTADCSGHEAGYEWAELHGIYDPADCGGRSRSFIEGCIAFAEGR